MALELRPHTILLSGILLANVLFAIPQGTTSGQSPAIEFGGNRVTAVPQLASRKLARPELEKPANQAWTSDTGFVIISDEPTVKRQPLVKRQPAAKSRERGALNENKNRFNRPTDQILNLADRRQGSLLGAMAELKSKFSFPSLSGKRAKTGPRNDKKTNPPRSDEKTTGILAAMADRMGRTSLRSEASSVRDPKVVPADYNNRSRQQPQPALPESSTNFSAILNPPSGQSGLKPGASWQTVEPKRRAPDFSTKSDSKQFTDLQIPRDPSQARPAPKTSKQAANSSNLGAVGGLFKRRQPLATAEQPTSSARPDSRQFTDLRIPRDPPQTRPAPKTSQPAANSSNLDVLGGLFKRRQRPTTAEQSTSSRSPQRVARSTSNQPPSATTAQPQKVRKRGSQRPAPQLQQSPKLLPVFAQKGSRPRPTKTASRPVPRKLPKITSLPTNRGESSSVSPAKPITEAITPAQERVAALIVEIHGKAQTATTETAYTDVVESCRHALAIESKGERAEYAKKLGAWALNRRGQVKADAGTTQQALLDFEDALRLDPNLWRAFHNRGVLRAQAGEFEQAFNDFNRCTELNPQFAKAYSNRAALFVQAGDLRSALQDYRHAIELDPDLAVAHQGRGRVCHMLGRLQKALYHFDAAAQLSASDDSHVITSRADLLTDIGRYTEAANEYKRAIDLDDQLAHAYRSSAWLLATCPDDSIRDSNLALKQAQQAIRLDNSQSAISLDTLAAAQANAGDFPSAIASLEQAIGISTEQERAIYEFRLKLYRSFQPFRTSPATAIQPASYGE